MTVLRLPLLILVTCVLAYFVWQEYGIEPVSRTAAPQRQAQSTDKFPAPNGPGAGTADPDAANPLGKLNVALLRDTLARPIFSSTRRPPPKVRPKERVPVAAPSRPRRESFALLGVVVGDDGRAIAVLRQASSGRSFRVEAGDTVAGWKVQTVKAASVTLTRAGDTIDLPLFKK